MDEDSLFEIGQCGGGLDSQLLCQQMTIGGVGLKGFRLPARRGQRLHQDASGSLMEGFFGHCRSRQRQCTSGLAEAEIGLGEIVDYRDMKLFEAVNLRLGELRIREFAKRRSPPRGDGGLELRCGRGRLP